MKIGCSARCWMHRWVFHVPARSSDDSDTVIPSASSQHHCCRTRRPASIRLTTDLETPACLARSDNEAAAASRVVLIVLPIPCATFSAVLALSPDRSQYASPRAQCLARSSTPTLIWLPFHLSALRWSDPLIRPPHYSRETELNVCRRCTPPPASPSCRHHYGRGGDGDCRLLPRLPALTGREVDTGATLPFTSAIATAFDLVAGFRCRRPAGAFRSPAEAGELLLRQRTAACGACHGCAPRPFSPAPPLPALRDRGALPHTGIGRRPRPDRLARSPSASDPVVVAAACYGHQNGPPFEFFLERRPTDSSTLNVSWLRRAANWPRLSHDGICTQP